MADREININAKIANLQKIKEELSKVQVNLTIKNSPEIDQLLKAAQNGLSIDIRFKVGPELKQLLDLQRKGLNLRYNMSGTGGSGARPSGTGNFFSSGQTFYGGANGAFMNQDQFRGQNQLRQRASDYQKNLQTSLNRIDQGNSELANQERQLEAQRTSLERQRQAEVRRQLNALNRVKSRQRQANSFVEENSLSALLGNDVVGQAADKFNLRRSSISARPNFFNPGRLKNPDNLQNILFTTLLGGVGQGIGAAAGVATLGPAGALLGANAAKALEDTFNDIAKAMTSAVRAGAEYERAVTGITGIFAATSELVGPGGKTLSIRDQLGIQNQRAEGIQKASQRALVPLGITGATSSALTQSLSAGLAQRGLAPDEKSTEILLRRFGAAIQTLQPELASDPNLIRRGFEDIIGGGPQASRTELGSAIRGLAPGLFSKNIKSVDDIVKATASLEELVVAIQNNDKATIEWRRALGSLELAQQELGKGILEGVAPGLKAFADELQKPEVSDGLRDLGKLIGELGSNLIRNAIPPLKGFIEKIQEFRQKLGLGGDGKTGDEGLEKLNEKRSLKGLAPLIRDEASGQLREVNTQQAIQSILQTYNNRFGIADPTQTANDSINGSTENKLGGLQRLRSILRKRLKSGEFASEIGLNSQEIALRRQAQQEKNELFDSGEFGQQRRALDEKGGLRDQIKLAEDTVSKRKALLRIEEAKSDKTEESVAQARLAVQKAEEEAIKLRNEVASKEKELAERRLAIFQKQLAAIDQTTFAGKDQALKLSKDFNFNQGLDIDRRIAAQDAIINSKTATAPEILAAKDRRSELLIEQQANQSAKAQDTRQGARNELNKLAFGIQQPLRREAQADAATKSQLELKQLEISTKELTLEQNKLSRATKDASKALDDYTKSTRLRELGREGEELAAAEAIVAAGGTVPAGVSESLVRGSASFDPEARALFEQELAREKFNKLSGDNTYDRLNREGAFGSDIKALQDDKTRLGFDQERLNLKPEELALQKRSILRDQKTQLIDNARAAQEALEQDPGNPELQREYADAYQKLQGLKKSEAASKATSPALGIPYGAPSTVPLGTVLPVRTPNLSGKGDVTEFLHPDFNKLEQMGINLYNQDGSLKSLNRLQYDATADIDEKRTSINEAIKKRLKLKSYYEAYGDDSGKLYDTDYSYPNVQFDGNKGRRDFVGGKELKEPDLSGLPLHMRLLYSGQSYDKIQELYKSGATAAERDQLKQIDAERSQRLKDLGLETPPYAQFDRKNIENTIEGLKRQYPLPEKYKLKVDSGEYQDLIASNDIGSALLGGIGGSGAYARAKFSSEKGNQAAVDILQGLGKDAAGRLKEDKEKGDRGNSIFDDLTALKPLNRQETTQAFLDALNSAFV